MHPVLPTIHVSGTTTGEAKAKGGADIIYGLSPTHDLSISPGLEAKTKDGIRNLISSKGSVIQDAEFMGSLTLTFIGIGNEADFQSFLEDNQHITAREDAMRECALYCADDYTGPKKDKDFCTYFKDVKKSSMAEIVKTDHVRLCPAGKATPENLKPVSAASVRDLFAGIPKWTLSLGGRGGGQTLKYIDNTSPAAPIERSVVKPSAAGGLSGFTRLPSGGKAFNVTLDGFLGLGLQHRLPEATGEWCAPIGNVDGKDFDGPGEQCKTAALGVPVTSRFVAVGVMVGLIDIDRQFWRIGAAWTTSAKFNGSQRLVHGFEVPLFIDFARIAKTNSSVEYKGLLKLAPRVERVYTAGGETLQFLLTLQLLGQRSLVASALDWI